MNRGTGLRQIISAIKFIRYFNVNRINFLHYQNRINSFKQARVYS